MIRRFGAALLGLALTLPLAAIPAFAHTSAGVSVTDYDVWEDLSGSTHIVGTVTNHTGTRQTNIQVTATFTDAGAAVVATESAAAMVTNLAPHSSSPFHIVEADDLSTATGNTVSVTSTTTTTVPAGGLHIEPGSLVGDTYTGTITNDSVSTGTDIRVYAIRMDGETITDAAASANIDELLGSGSDDFTITFDDESTGADVTGFIAKTNSGTFLTSWNNYFGDLGNSSFVEEIAYLADEGITLGCGGTSYCPTGNVTREQMALFLTRALGLSDTSDFGFTDIGDRSAAAQDAINALANAGVTSGCSTDPVKYCPTDTVTRGQMSKFMVTGYSIPAATGDFVDSFTDDDGHFSEDYNDAMKQSGVTLGCGATTYCPFANVTREQMAAFIYRAETLP